MCKGCDHILIACKIETLLNGLDVNGLQSVLQSMIAIYSATLLTSINDTTMQIQT